MSEIQYTDFIKLEMRVGKIIEATIPEGSEHLIQLRVDFGKEGAKTIFAGIKKWYEPQSLIGKKTLFAFNLAPKKTPFGDSEGMLLATGEDEAKIIFVDDTLEEGSLLR